MEDKNGAILKAWKKVADLKLWFDGSKLDNAKTSAVIVWKKESISEKWQKRKISL